MMCPAGGVDQRVECLPSKFETHSSNPSTTKKKKKSKTNMACPYEKEKLGHTLRHRLRMPAEDHSYTATNQGMLRTPGQPQKLGERHGRGSHSHPWKEPALPTLSFDLPDSRTVKQFCFTEIVCLSHTICGALFRQP
jgi:hypothetical protein